MTVGIVVAILGGGGAVAEAQYNQNPSGCTGISDGVTCFHIYGENGSNLGTACLNLFS